MPSQGWKPSSFRFGGFAAVVIGLVRLPDAANALRHKVVDEQFFSGPPKGGSLTVTLEGEAKAGSNSDGEDSTNDNTVPDTGSGSESDGADGTQAAGPGCDVPKKLSYHDLQFKFTDDFGSDDVDDDVFLSATKAPPDDNKTDKKTDNILSHIKQHFNIRNGSMETCVSTQARGKTHDRKLLGGPVRYLALVPLCTTLELEKKRLLEMAKEVHDDYLSRKRTNMYSNVVYMYSKPFQSGETDEAKFSNGNLNEKCFFQVVFLAYAAVNHAAVNPDNDAAVNPAVNPDNDAAVNRDKEDYEHRDPSKLVCPSEHCGKCSFVSVLDDTERRERPGVEVYAGMCF